MKKLSTLVILSFIGITQIYSQCYQCDNVTKAFTIGTQTAATGDNSFAGGFRSLTSGENSFVFGVRASATQSGGIAIGNNANSYATNSIVFGQSVTGNASNSITMGVGSSSLSPLINNKPNSIMFGVTEIPSLTIVKPFGADVGYIGIGTEEPAEMLHITGNILSEGDLTVKDKIILTPDYTDSTYWEIERNNDGLNFVHTIKQIYEHDTNDMKGSIGSLIVPVSYNRLFISKNGNVGIGTTTPSAKLDIKGAFNAQSANIAGKLKTKEVQVTLTGWPDYVFSKDYNLIPLSELQSFITENQHLPNIPSAAEVEENGVELGEMNAKLLQKVEELTLYILDLQKQIDELKTK